MGYYTDDLSKGFNTPIIAEYKNDEWYNTGNLKQNRNAHGVITYGSMTMVIGGQSADMQPWVIFNKSFNDVNGIIDKS